jgi:DNA-binding YbaB/EbfC family protein
VSDIEEGGGFDLGALLKSAQAMQEQVMAAQSAAADEIVEGHAGGGVVSVTVNGAMEFQSVHIEPKAVDPNDVEMLEDLVLAAIHDAVARVNELNQQAFGGFEIPGMPGLSLPGLSAPDEDD